MRSDCHQMARRRMLAGGLSRAVPASHSAKPEPEERGQGRPTATRRIHQGLVQRSRYVKKSWKQAGRSPTWQCSRFTLCGIFPGGTEGVSTCKVLRATLDQINRPCSSDFHAFLNLTCNCAAGRRELRALSCLPVPAEVLVKVPRARMRDGIRAAQLRRVFITVFRAAHLPQAWRFGGHAERKVWRPPWCRCSSAACWLLPQCLQSPKGRQAAWTGLCR